MKSFVLMLGLCVAAASYAQVKNWNMYVWEPLVFEVDASAAQTAMDDMAARKDPTLQDLEANYPGFRGSFVKAFAFLAPLELQSYAIPPLVLPSVETKRTPEERLQLLGSEIGAVLDGVRSRIMNKIYEVIVPYWEDGDKHMYLYCENNPGLTLEVCEDSKYDYEWVFARRLTSNAKFVRQMCPAVVPFLLWNLNWNDHGSGRGRDYDLFFDEVDRVLNLYYNNGVWTHTLLGTISSPFGKEVLQALERRYLDGGPEMILAMKECAAEARDAFKNQKPASDPRASQGIAGILKFTDVPMNMTGQTLSVQTAPLMHGNLYRLVRHMDEGAMMPPSEAEYHLTMLNIVRLTQHLTQLDPVYSYRLMTRAEYEALKQDKQPIVDRESMCLVSHDYVRDGLAGLRYYYAYDTEMEESYEDNVCSQEDFAIIRERK